MIISFQHVQKYYGANLVLSDISFEVGDGEKVGLIGRNGSGKTTIFELLHGTLLPDQGQISIRKGANVGLLAQVPAEKDGWTVLEVLGEGYREVRRWECQMRELEAHMADPAVASNEQKLQRMLEQYGQLLTRFEEAGGYEMDASIDRVAAGLGISSGQYGRLFSSLSGGEKTKVGLAALLLQRPDILLLDEPTNHLDMPAIEWLETFLASYPGSVLVVSHDRYFLDHVVGKIIEIEDGEASVYFTNYTDYQKEKEARLLRQFAEYQEQQKKIKKMKETIKQLIEWGNRSNPPNPGFHRRAASMQKALDRMVKLKRPILERRSMDLKLQQEDRSGRQAVVLDQITKTYGERILLNRASVMLEYAERVALIGENGSGKSTLLKMLLGQLGPDEGEIRIGSRVEVGYLAQEETPPKEAKTVLQYFREEVSMEEGAARGELARFLFFGPDVFKRVENLSGGEWSRLRLALLMFRMPNLLLLDEPTNHLDIESREALEEALELFPGTLLVISHDRYFINRIARKIWMLKQGELSVHLGNYEDCRDQFRAQALNSAVLAETTIAESGRENNASNRRQVKPERDLPSAPRKSDNRWPQQCEQEILETEACIQALEEQMGESTGEWNEEEWNKLLAERTKLQQRLDSLYAAWLEQ